MSAALIAIEKRMEMLRVYHAYVRGEPSDVVVSDFAKARQVADALLYVDDVYIAPDIVELLHAQQNTLPTNMALHDTDLPLPRGWAWFGSPWALPVGAYLPGQETVVDAIMWTPSRIDYVPLAGGQRVVDGWMVSVFGRVVGQHDTKTAWLWDSLWPTGSPLDDELGAAEVQVIAADGSTSSIIDPRPDEAGFMLTVPSWYRAERSSISLHDARTYQYLRTLAVRTLAFSVWHFMQQKVVSRERVHPDRAMRRRFEGFAVLPEPPSVQVIRLRRLLRPRRQPSGDERQHEVMVRHVVSGHWRTYHVGPRHSRYVDRDGTGGLQPVLLWIDPFVRGPGDMPLHAPHKLFQVNR